MNISIKNNRNLLRKGRRKQFKELAGGYKLSRSYMKYEMPFLFSHKLKRVRRKIQKENRRLLKVKLITAVLGLSILIYVFYHFFIH